MAELGLLGVCIPEQYGGAGFDYVSLGLVCEELEACDTFLRVAMSVHVGLNSLSLLQLGNRRAKAEISRPAGERRKDRDVWPDRAECRIRRCRDAFVCKTRRRRLDLERREDVDLAWRMSPIIFCFFAGPIRKSKRFATTSGISCFIVERTMPGFSSGTLHGKLGIQGRKHGLFFAAGRSRAAGEYARAGRRRL